MPEIDEHAFRRQLERLVELLPAESSPYFEDRSTPRFAHAVLVYADEKEGELLTASCIKQLDGDNERDGRRDFAQLHEYETSTTDLNATEEDEEEEAPVEVDALHARAELPFVPLGKFVRSEVAVAEPARFRSAVVVEADAPAVREERLTIGRADAQNGGPIFVRRETQRTTIDRFDPNAQPVEFERTFRIPPQGTIYDRPEIVSRTYKSTVEETTFPSIDRYRSVRSETMRFVEPRSPRGATPLESRTTRTITHSVSAAPPAPEDDAISEAVRILQTSVDLLDETSERLARRRLLDGNVRFPSESRKSETTA